MFNVISNVSRFTNGKFAAPYSVAMHVLYSIKHRLVAYKRLTTCVDHAGLSRLIFAKLNYNSIDDLKKSCSSIAITANETAKVLKALVELKRQELLTRPADLLASIRGEIATRGYTAEEAALIDIDLLTELIARSTSSVSDMTLREVGVDSYIHSIVELLEQLETNLLNDMNNSNEPVDVPHYLGSLKMIDYIFSLVHNPNVAAALPGVSATGGSAEAKNRDRMVACQTISTLFHSVRSCELFAQVACWQYAKATVEAWIGPLPSHYAQGTDPITTYITPYDALGTVASISNGLRNVHGHTPGNGEALNFIPADLFNWVGVAKQLADVESTYKPYKSITRVLTTDLTVILEDTDLMATLTQSAVGSVPDIFTANLLYTMSEQFRAKSMEIATNTRAATLELLHKDYYADATKLVQAGVTDFLASFHLTERWGKSLSPAVQFPHIALPINAPAVNGHAQDVSGMVLKYNVGSLLTFTKYFPVGDGFDLTAYNSIDASYKKFRTLYPQYLAGGVINEGSVKVAGIDSTVDAVELLASLLDRSRYTLEGELNSPTFVTQMATVASSFAVFYAGIKATIHTGVPVPFDAEEMKVIEGQGNPYGVTYAELGAKCGGATVIPINKEGTLFMRLLEWVPSPTDEVATCKIDFKSFQQSRGDASSRAGWRSRARTFAGLDEKGNRKAVITKLVKGPAMYNFVLIPGAEFSSRVKLFHDFKSIYRNDVIVGEFNPGTVPPAAVEFTFNTGLKTHEWVGQKVSPMLDFIGFGAGSENAADEFVKSQQELAERMKADASRTNEVPKVSALLAELGGQAKHAASNITTLETQASNNGKKKQNQPK